jgi:Fe-S cluster assembly ATPase SufC
MKKLAVADFNIIFDVFSILALYVNTIKARSGAIIIAFQSPNRIKIIQI